MNGHLTIILAEARLGTILDDQTLPAGWVKGLYDRKLQPIVAGRDGHKGSDLPVPAALATRLADAGPDSTITGAVEALDDRGIPVLVTFRRSGATNWTSVVTVPLADLNSPVTAALWRMAGPASLLLLAGGIAAWLTARQVEQPLRTLSDQVTGAKKQVSELSSQLLALQEEERQRIARELHDSTAQHLVAANLELACLRRQAELTGSEGKQFDQMNTSLQEAMKEIRTFSYLMHPPALRSAGLNSTIKDYVAGFSNRTNIDVRARLNPTLDRLPFEMQRTFLRIAQEALANVHRHAGASHINLDFRCVADRVHLIVKDNGRGNTPSNERAKFGSGCGVSGMTARAHQFGGVLRMRTGSRGTTLHVVVPAQTTSDSAHCHSQ
jgi:two-component system, NarL family, sensor kinase